MKKKLLFIIAGLVITAAILIFQPSRKIQNDLILAEELMSEQPDSALHILEKIKASSLVGENRALYALLMTQAQFKNHQFVESDSLFKVAYNFYLNGNDSLRKAQAYFYRGRIYEDFDNVKEAISFYQKASITAKQTEDNGFLALIYSRWGALLFKQKLDDDALEMQNKSLEYSVLDTDTLKQIFVLRDIGIICSAHNKYKEAISYFSKALHLAELINNADRISNICANLGYVYKCMSKFDLGIYYVNKSISLLPNKVSLCTRYSLKGDLFMLNQQYDSARYYLELSRQSDDIDSEASYCTLMSTLEEKLGNYKTALDLSNQYIKYIFRIADTEKQKSIAELQKKYDYSLVKNEKVQLELEKKNKNILILMMVIVFIVVIWFITYQYNRVRHEKDRIIKDGEEQLRQVADKLIERELELAETQLKSKAEIDSYMEWVLSKNEVMKKIEELTKMGTTERIANKEKMKLTSNEVVNLKDVVNICFDNFASRLVKRFPGMTEENVQYCCLLRMKIPADIIAMLLGVSDGSLIKRKYRLKKEISAIMEDVSSLEVFFLKF